MMICCEESDDLISASSRSSSRSSSPSVRSATGSLVSSESASTNKPSKATASQRVSKFLSKLVPWGSSHAATDTCDLEKWLKASSSLTFAAKQNESYDVLASRAAQPGALTIEKGNTIDYEAAIQKDLPRTFFADTCCAAPPEQQEALQRVLRALALWDMEVAYPQGLSFIAAFVLWKCSTDAAGTSCQHCEEKAFWLVACLLQTYRARNFFIAGMPLVHVYSFCLERLLLKRMPGVHGSLSATLRCVADGWFCTLFTRVLPTPVVAHVWSMLFQKGWSASAMFSVVMALCSILVERAQAECEGEDVHDCFWQLLHALPSDASLLLSLEEAQANAAPDGKQAARRLLKAAASAKTACVTDSEMKRVLLEFRPKNRPEAEAVAQELQRLEQRQAIKLGFRL